MGTSASTVGRAATILTTGEVVGATLDLQSTSLDHAVTVELDFTLGSLDNEIVRFYGSSDNVTFRPISVDGTVLTETLTANATRCYVVRVPGIRYFRASVQGTGTVTSSSCAYTYRYQPYLTATPTDGAARLL
jgi:hypothetical protein